MVNRNCKFVHFISVLLDAILDLDEGGGPAIGPRPKPSETETKSPDGTRVEAVEAGESTRGMDTCRGVGLLCKINKTKSVIE